MPLPGAHPPPPFLELAPTDFDPNDQDRYHVVRVAADDTLNVRAGAGIDNPVVWELGPTERGILRTGRTATVGGDIWWELRDDVTGLTGWANSNYLQFDGRY